eukprot:TRINITY_DN57360_c0_g1_i1.p1 TRINITY_DN57360_c0_g1~~TRINITY_DN57360_c0_g1_i1.p1  ORF type:complete len:793 (-),score=182.24 TRINITY_DN57360_c0_g1_i1:268-2646(-)
MHAFPSSALGPRSSRPELVFRLSPPGASKLGSGLQDNDSGWRSLAGCTVNNWHSSTLAASAAARARLAQSNNFRRDEDDEVATDNDQDEAGDAADDATAASAASSEQQEQSATMAEEDAAYKALHSAIVRHCDFRVSELLQASETPQSVLHRKDADGHTLLHQAVLSSPSKQTAAIVSFLQAAGADVEARNLLGETPLVVAVRTALDFPGSAEGGFDALCVVRCLLERGADVDVADEITAETPLMEAACQGSREACQLLLSFRADASKVADGGKTAVDFALSGGHSILANLLCEAVDKAPKPEAPPPEVATPAAPEAAAPAASAAAPAAFASCCSGWPRLLQSMSDQVCRFVSSNLQGLWSMQPAAPSIDGGSASDACADCSRISGEPEIGTHQVLLQAIQESCDVRVRELLKGHDLAAALNHKDSDGLSLLHHAALAPPSRQAAAIVACLQSCGAEIEAKNLLGETALLLSVRAALDCSEDTLNSHRLSIVKCLLEAGADANAADELTGETSLTEAACRGSKELCELLLSFRADASKATNGGVTAIDFANNEGHEELARFLAEHASRGQKKAAPSAGEAEPKTKKKAGYATDYGFTNWQSAGFTQRTFFAEKEAEQERKNNAAGPRSKPESKSTPSADHWDWCHGAGPGGGFQAGGNFFRPGQMPGAFRPGHVPGSFGNFGAGHFGSSRMPFMGGLPGRAGASNFSSLPGFDYSAPKGFDGAAQRRRKLAGLEQHFRTLGLGMDASNDQIRTAYRKLALQHHPDKNQGSQRAAEQFKKIQLAYEAISERLS